MNKIENPGSVHEPKDGTLALSLEEIKKLINLLVRSLSFYKFVIQSLFAKHHESSSDDDDFFDILLANTLEGGCQKVLFPKQILEKTSFISIDEEGKRIVDYWSIMEQDYDPNDKYDT